MNNKEAIYKLEYMRNAYQKLIDEKVDEGRLVGTGITGTWMADTPLNDAYEEHIEAIDLAITALEKQEPMRPLQKEMNIEGRAITPCGFCGEELPNNAFYDFCPYCGQKIDRRRKHDKD